MPNAAVDERKRCKRFLETHKVGLPSLESYFFFPESVWKVGFKSIKSKMIVLIFPLGKCSLSVYSETLIARYNIRRRSVGKAWAWGSSAIVAKWAVPLPSTPSPVLSRDWPQACHCACITLSTYTLWICRKDKCETGLKAWKWTMFSVLFKRYVQILRAECIPQSLKINSEKHFIISSSSHKILDTIQGS